ncbi:hypothetical protein [Thiomicrorhabdus indica]|uniref:hypothetical protein n=1 Tax=Thiomicrorhabdus indica TaxID=2267253 RepID=UPI00102DB97D|nr:hypothetical protein [Thiomicrorhabdus indica]
MSKPIFENLVVGTAGWQTPEVSQSFYPEDLPCEWQLDYYSNFSNLVVVPQSFWLSQLSLEDEGAQESREEFVDALLDESQVFLVLDCTENLDVFQKTYAKLCQMLDSFADELSIAGVIFKFEQRLSEQSFAEILSVFDGLYKNYTNSYLSLILPAGIDLTLYQDQLEKMGLDYLQESESVCVGDPLLWINALSADGKQQAQVLKTFVENLPAGKEGAPVVVAGSENHKSIQMSAVQNVKVVSELMGY